MPTPANQWSTSLWWPQAGMFAARPPANFEGIDHNRLVGRGVVLFNDGHAETRKDEEINPPVNPSSLQARALLNIRYWDPLIRTNL